jgi:transposase-like protein
MSTKYSEELQRQIVTMRLNGHSNKELTERYKLGKNTIRDWVRSASNPKSDAEIAEKKQLKQMQSQIKRLNEEVELLKHLALSHIQTSTKKSK